MARPRPRPDAGAAPDRTHGRAQDDDRVGHVSRFVAAVLVMAVANATIVGVLWSASVLARTGYRRRDAALLFLPFVGLALAITAAWRFAAPVPYWHQRSQHPLGPVSVERRPLLVASGLAVLALLGAAAIGVEQAWVELPVPEQELRSIEELRPPPPRQPTVGTGEIGADLVELGGLHVGVEAVRVERPPAGLASAKVEVAVRFENRTDIDGVVPGVSLRCDGDQTPWLDQPGSTYIMGTPLPARSFQATSIAMVVTKRCGVAEVEIRAGGAVQDALMFALPHALTVKATALTKDLQREVFCSALREITGTNTLAWMLALSEDDIHAHRMIHRIIDGAPLEIDTLGQEIGQEYQRLYHQLSIADFDLEHLRVTMDGQTAATLERLETMAATGTLVEPERSLYAFADGFCEASGVVT